MVKARRYEMCIERDCVEKAGGQEKGKAKSLSNIREVLLVIKDWGKELCLCVVCEVVLGIKYFRPARWLGSLEGKLGSQMIYTSSRSSAPTRTNKLDE